MIKNLLLLGLVLCGIRVGAVEPVNLVALNLRTTAEHPRNSEGSFVTLKSGRILFLYSQFSEGASDFSPCRIAQISSDDQGRTWSEPRALFTPEPNTLEMSVSLLRLASGKIALFTAIKHGLMDCQPYLRISSDEGVTWSPARRILKAPGYFVLNNDRIIQTSAGRLIMPLAYHRVLGEATGQESHSVDLRAIALWYYSDDEGATWTESKSWWALPVASATGMQEPGVVELADGSLLSWVRTDQGRQYACRSKDTGVTWSAPEPMTLHSPASPASIKRLPGSKDLLAVFNDYSGQFPFAVADSTYRGRTPLVAATSADNGRTWRTAKLLEDDPRSDYCYTAIHFDGDAVLLSYLNFSGPSKSQVVRRINLAWLTAPDDALAARAKGILHDVFAKDETWIKIHAAEALLVGGEATAMRERLLKMAPTADGLLYRVGVWRVLASTSPTRAERDACVAQVEKIFLNPASPDSSQALETLCKLRVRVEGPVLERVRQTLTGPSEPMRVLALWSLALRDEPQALERLGAWLSSPTERMRAIAAYALRWMKTTDAKALALLAEAADAEPVGTDTQAYLISAAFALNAKPAQRAAWRATLEQVLAKGSMEARWEACHGLLPHATTANLPHYLPLLEDAGADTRVGAAMTVLYVRARE